MSERGSLHKAKTINLQEFPDVQGTCLKYADSKSTIELAEFMPILKRIEKETLEIDPDTMQGSKEIFSAINKSFCKGLEKLMQLLSNDLKDNILSLKEFVKDFTVICENFIFFLKKSTMKADKSCIGLMNGVIVTLISQPDACELHGISFLLISALNEIVAGSKLKKMDMKAHDLCNQIYAIYDESLLKLLTDKSSVVLASRPYEISGPSKKSSLFNSSYHESITTDLVHYLLISIENLLKAESGIYIDFIKSILPSILVYLLDIPDFCSTILSTSTDLAIQKYLISLNILKLLCQNTSKLDLARNFLKSNSEKIKNIFFYTLVSYSKYYFDMNGVSFEFDNGVLGKLYMCLYDIFSIVAANSEQEGLPILLLSVILQNVKNI